MTLDLEPEKLSKRFAKVNKTISQISPRPQTQCSEGEINLNSDNKNNKEKIIFLAKEFKGGGDSQKMSNITVAIR